MQIYPHAGTYFIKYAYCANGLVNKSICYESIACGREECSAMFHFFP